MRRGSWSGFGSLIATGLETGAAALRSLSSYWKLVLTFAFVVAVARPGAMCDPQITYTSVRQIRVCEIKTCLFAVFGDLHIFWLFLLLCSRQDECGMFVHWNCGSRCLGDLIKRYQTVWAAQQAFIARHALNGKDHVFSSGKPAKIHETHKHKRLVPVQVKSCSVAAAAAANGQCLMAWKGAANALDYGQVGSTLVAVVVAVEDAHTRCCRSCPQCYQEIVTLVENHDRKFQNLNYLNLATANDDPPPPPAPMVVVVAA